LACVASRRSLVTAEFVPEVKGRDLMVDRFAELLGVTGPAAAQ
jgi:hypothetical protein